MGALAESWQTSYSAPPRSHWSMNHRCSSWPPGHPAPGKGSQSYHRLHRDPPRDQHGQAREGPRSNAQTAPPAEKTREDSPSLDRTCSAGVKRPFALHFPSKAQRAGMSIPDRPDHIR
ncbi:hypothetical protein L210DRAFT_2993335 [Boletus edulis BED1]|uniref:Uncharacterized protein n=1 Tax=Boletus edulis BED1 TaxID=1328754 RepID=A0AAD4G5K4_BOLED|nr:hypothetical protein L210DRAFT_2993335 [Boletus edulis BED1]